MPLLPSVPSSTARTCRIGMRGRRIAGWSSVAVDEVVFLLFHSSVLRPPILLFIPSPFLLHGGFSLECLKADYRAYSSIETVFTYCVIRNPLRLYWKSRLVYVAACLVVANDIAKDKTVVDGAAKGLLRLMPRWYTSTPNNNNI